MTLKDYNVFRIWKFLDFAGLTLFLIQVYRLDEVASHNNEQDLWMAIHNKVYDVTKFTDEV